MFEFLVIVAIVGLSWVANLAIVTVRYYNTPKNKRDKIAPAFNLAWGRDE